MAQINLGIDVDSTSFATAETRSQGFKASLTQLQATMVGLEKTTRGNTAALNSLNSAVAANTAKFGAFNASTRESIASVNGLRSAYQSFVGVLAAAGVGLLVRDLANFTTELSRVKSTLEQVAGSTAGANAEFEYLRATSDRLGVSYMAVAGSYSKLLAAASASNVPMDQTRILFEGITAASVKFGLSQEQTAGSLNALQQIMSKGKVTAEELNGQLGERLPGAAAIAAKALGMTMPEMFKKMEQGAISASEFIDKFGQELSTTFVAAAEQMDSVGTRSAELRNAFDDLRSVVVESGFRDAMMEVLGALNEFARSDEAEQMARDLGEAFRDLGGAAVGAIESIGPLRTGYSDWSSDLGTFVSGGGPLGQFISGMSDADKAVNDAIDAAEAAKVSVNLLGWEFEVVDGKILSAIGQTGTLEGAWRGLAAYIDSGLTAALARAGAAFQKAVSAAAAYAAGIGNALGTPTPYGAGGGISGHIGGDPNAAPIGVRRHPQSQIDAAREASLRNQAALGQQIGRHAEFLAMAERDAAAAAAKLQEETEATIPPVKTVTSSLGGGGAAAKKTVDELLRAKDILGEEAKLSERLKKELAGGAVESSYAAKEMEKMEDALRKSGMSLEAFLRTQGQTVEGWRASLESVTAMEESLERQADLAKGISGGLMTIMSGDMSGGLSEILGSITESVGTEMQQEIDKLGEKIARGVSGLTGQGGMLDSVTMSGVGMGLGNAAVAALDGNKEGIGTGLGQAAGAAIGSAIPGIGTALGGVLGGLAGGFMSKIFGDDVKRDNVTGTVFGGTPYAQQANSRNFSQEDDKTGALSLMQDGLIKLLEEFDRSITLSARGLVASTKDLRAINLQVEDIDKAREMIAGTLSDTIYKKGGQTEELAKEIEVRTAAFMQLSTAVAVSGKTAATEAQLAFRQINEDFSDANVEMLRVVGFTGKQIRAAQEEAVGQLSDSLNEEMLGTLISLNRATAEELAMWKDMELASLAERRSAAIKTAREIGASEDLVRSSFKAQRKDVNAEYRDMLRDMVADTKGAAKNIKGSMREILNARVAEAEAEALKRGERRLTKFGTRADLFGSIADDPGASRKDIKRAKEAAVALGKEQFKEQIKAARKAGIDMKDIEKAWQSERKQIAKGFAQDNIKVEKDKVRSQDVNNKEWKDAKRQGGKVLHDEIRDLRRRNKEAEQANRDRAKEAREKAKAARQEARDLKAQAIEMTRSLWAVLAGAPGASEETMTAAKQAEIAAAKASYKQMRKDAKKNGVDLNLVEQAWQAERLGIAQSYAQQMRQTETDRLAMISGLRDTIAGGKNASEDDIKAARRAAIDLAKRGYKEEIREAKKRGVDLALVEKAWQVERKGIMQSYGERLAEVLNKPLDKAIRQLTRSIEKSQDRLSRIEEKRSNVLAELASRTEQMRSAESALRDVRRDLMRSTELAPGGPMERFAEIQKQFQAAIGKAQGGDSDAAQRAAGLAQELLGSGREVYASSGGYADLFKQVNSDLMGVQKSIGKDAKQIEKQLDKETFSDVTERSTTALLRALGTLNGSMKEVKGEIKAQNKALKDTETKRRIA